MGSKSYVTSAMFCFCNPFCFRLLSTMLFVYIHISPWLSFTGICLVKLEVGDIDLQSCAAENFYCGLCYAGGRREGIKKKNEKVLFHLGSNLWLGLPALAKLKLAGCGLVSSTLSALLHEQNWSSQASNCKFWTENRYLCCSFPLFA